MGIHRPPVVMPDMKRRRASTGEKIETIMNLARRLPLTRQILATSSPTPRQPDGVRGGMDECRTRIPGTLQTLPAPETGRIPRRQGTRRLRLDPDPLPRRLRKTADRIPGIHQRPRGPRPVRASRHRARPTSPSRLAGTHAAGACPCATTRPQAWSCGSYAPRRTIGSTGNSP
ncbi:IstB-like ATP-binding protein [Bifidobacterium bifidum]|nr:IstB-like ATP-binding protein [Bifidobacterium bifidum]